MSTAPPFHRQSLSEVHAWIDANVGRLPAVSIPLADAADRVLATALSASTEIPPRTMAAIDGYAVNAAQTVGASDYSPLPFRLVEGDTALKTGECCALTAGSPLPPLADAVVDNDLAQRLAQRLELSGSVATGDGVIGSGDEYHRGQLILPAGRHLRPQDLAMLALAGYAAVDVVAAPRVDVILASAFERDANGPMLRALIRRDGGLNEGTGQVASAAALEAALAASKADMILLVGGSNRGDNDFGVASVARSGSVDIYGVAIHPGDSTALGRIGNVPVVVLPGTPIACFCAYDLVVAPLLRQLSGLNREPPYPVVQRPLARKVASRIGRLEVCRVVLQNDAAMPVAIADDRLLSTTVTADGFVLIAENSEGHAAGTVVPVFLYSGSDVG